MYYSTDFQKLKKENLAANIQKTVALHVQEFYDAAKFGHRISD
jgi:hypothetical protein